MSNEDFIGPPAPSEFDYDGVPIAPSVPRPPRLSSSASKAEQEAWLHQRNTYLRLTGQMSESDFATAERQVTQSWNETPPWIQETGAFVGGLADAALHPVDTLQRGLEWEGEFVGSTAGNVLKGAGSAISSAIGGAGKGLVSGIAWWLWLLAAGALFVWLGGGKWLKSKAQLA